MELIELSIYENPRPPTILETNKQNNETQDTDEPDNLNSKSNKSSFLHIETYNPLKAFYAQQH